MILQGTGTKSFTDRMLGGELAQWQNTHTMLQRSLVLMQAQSHAGIIVYGCRHILFE